MGRGKTLVAVSIALLPLGIGLVWGGILLVRGAPRETGALDQPGQVHLSQVGSYTAADSTVPVGIHGHAEIALGMGLSGQEKDFDALIGDDPANDTNVSRWELILDGYHGAGYVPGGVRRPTTAGCASWSVTSRATPTPGDSDHSKAAGVRHPHQLADAPMTDPAIREIQGTVSCHVAVRREPAYRHDGAEQPLRCLRRRMVPGA